MVLLPLESIVTAVFTTFGGVSSNPKQQRTRVTNMDDFRYRKARAGHWGLPGIRELAKRIGARLQLWSESGSGADSPRLSRLRCVSCPPPIWALSDQNQGLMRRGPRNRIEPGPANGTNSICLLPY